MYQIEQKLCKGTKNVLGNKIRASVAHYGIEFWPCVVLYGLMWPHMVLLLFTAIIWLALCDLVGSCMALYGLVWPCMALYGLVWLSMNIVLKFYSFYNVYNLPFLSNLETT